MMLSKRSALTIILASSLVIACAGTKNVGGGLWGMLGGGKGVSAVANSFGANLAGNAAVSQALGSGGAEAAKMGLYNSIAKSGGYGVEQGSDLLTVLKDKKLDAAAVSGVESSLNAAGKEAGLKPEQMAGLTALWDPIEKTLLKGK